MCAPLAEASLLSIIEFALKLTQRVDNLNFVVVQVVGINPPLDYRSTTVLLAMSTLANLRKVISERKSEGAQKGPVQERAHEQAAMEAEQRESSVRQAHH